VANLAEAFLRKVVRRFENTRIGRQELYAELMVEQAGALWTREGLDRHRVRAEDVPELTKVYVGVDPMAKETAKRRKLAPPETGIVIAGLGEDGHGYVLNDCSTGGKPDRWARRVIRAFHDYECDRVIAETNNGGDMVVDVINTRDRTVPVRQVTASRGKRTRAEPISGLYEQGRVHHVGHLGKLEDQMCNWTGEDGEPSPDRLDAVVWALSALMLGPGVSSVRVDPSVGHIGSEWEGY
jgi:predicted phage terminase large subunit-like protein